MPKSGLDYKWIVLVNTTFAVFMTSLDNTILTVSLPDILHSLNATVVEVIVAIVSTTMSYQTLVGLFSGSAEGASTVDAAAFMDGLHKVFVVGAAVTLIAILCSALRGTDEAPATAASLPEQARAAVA